MIFFSPSCQKVAEFLEVLKTAYGAQENLYAKGLSAYRASGKPPHHDSYPIILAPLYSTSSFIFIVLMISIPGSKPISLKKIKSLSYTSLSNAHISADIYEAVTICFPASIHGLATFI